MRNDITADYDTVQPYIGAQHVSDKAKEHKSILSALPKLERERIQESREYWDKVLAAIL